MSTDDDEDDTTAPRVARLGGVTVTLEGRAPEVGERLSVDFNIPCARGATGPLTAADLRCGLVVVSTLPNIAKRACTAQIVRLERLRTEMPFARVVHVASDGFMPWAEVDHYHPDVEAPGFALGAAAPSDAAALKRGFGVGVHESHRVAHGLFALVSGVFCMVDIPFDQYRTPAVDRFCDRVLTLLHSVAATPFRSRGFHAEG